MERSRRSGEGRENRSRLNAHDPDDVSRPPRLSPYASKIKVFGASGSTSYFDTAAGACPKRNLSGKLGRSAEALPGE